MEAETRFSRYDLVSHALLSWYSLCLLSYSVFEYQKELLTIMSAAILVLSSIIWGMRFGESASSHRSCYLELEKLYGSEDSQTEKQAKYQEIIGRYRNHSKFDYDSVLNQRIAISKRIVRGREGAVNFGSLARTKYLFRKYAAVLAVFFAFASPILIGFFNSFGAISG